ncbi:MAG: hypothetical protein U9P79_00045 [Candidatus Cloacimonadota bacterium]|nr:hypothetical protein [Candidatus Cloacimonadota bacterium]
MKKLIILTVVLLISGSLFAVYNVGDTVNDYSWTDNTGAAHSIYELTEQGTAVVLFWGGTS